VALGSDPGTLDFSRWPEGNTSPLFWALAETLVGVDAKSGLMKPGLAESWSVKDEGRTWAFTLRAARWSDGSPVTAFDVAEAWQRSLTSAEVIGAAVLDAKHLTVQFRQAPESAAVFASYRYAVTAANPETRSAGPFRFDSAVAGRSVTVVKNPLYREAAAVGFGKVTFVFTDSPDTAALLYKKRRVDWAPLGGGPGTALRPTADAVVSAGWGVVWLRLNLGTPPFDNLAFRQGLVRSLDRPGLLQGLRGPLLVPLEGFVPRTLTPTAQPKPKAATKPAIKAPAPALSPGLPGFTILHAAGETNHRLAADLGAQWSQKLGLGIDSREGLAGPVRDDREAGRYEAVLSSWVGDSADPLTFLAHVATWYTEPKFGTLVAAAETAPLGKERDKLVADAEKLLTDDWPAVPLASYARVNLIDPARWKGWYANPTDVHPWSGFGPKK
jgi:oligopeptide transport system substrate-binding protein